VNCNRISTSRGDIRWLLQERKKSKTSPRNTAVGERQFFASALDAPYLLVISCDAKERSVKSQFIKVTGSRASARAAGLRSGIRFLELHRVARREVLVAAVAGLCRLFRLLLGGVAISNRPTRPNRWVANVQLAL
jgi:hypothetical protein